MSSHPPKYFLRFFRWFCHPRLQKPIEGDLMELYQERVKELGKRRAGWKFRKDVLLLLRKDIIQASSEIGRINQLGFLKNYFKVAYRNLLRNKAFSLINISGLTVGIASCLLIFMYVDFEKSYDNFHEDGNDIYRITADHQGTEVQKSLSTPPPLGRELQERFPEVVSFTRLLLPWSGQAAASTLSWENEWGNTIVQNFKWGFYTDPGFSELFSFAWIKGDSKQALQGANRIVLSERAAQKIFGNDWRELDLIGEVLEYVNEFDHFQLTITGIIEDAPENSHIEYDFLASFSTLSTGWGKGYAESWDGPGVYTYLKLNSKSSELAENIQGFYEEVKPETDGENTVLSLQSLSSIHLNSHRPDELNVNGNAETLSFLSLIAVAVLGIALINYINLTTAKAVSRGHEVGIRKVMGALRPQLVKQFLFESFLINGIAFLLALLLLQLALPFFQTLIGKAISGDWNSYLPFIFFLFLVNTLLSGLYPAFVLSGYEPLRVLKGKLTHSRSGENLRKSMVVFQFVVSVGLIIFTIAVQRQLHFMRTEDPGFDRKTVIVIKGPANRLETWIEHDKNKGTRDHTDVFKNAMDKYPSIQATSISWSIPGERSSIYSIELGSDYANAQLDVISADNDYAEVYGLEIAAGEFRVDTDFVINESSARILGYTDPFAAVGKTFLDEDSQARRISGVVKDYHHHSLNEKIRPLIFQSNDPTYKLDSYYSLKADGSDVKNLLGSIEQEFIAAYPFDTFEYYSIDSYFDAQYKADIQLGVIFGFFSGLTIFIACLGLFGLSLFMVIVKTREIGIRKVLGASARRIVGLFVSNTLKLVLVATALALPLAYWGTSKWLSNFPFRIELGWLFFIPVLIAPVIVFAIIGLQTWRAASANPVDCLHDE